MFKRIGDWMCSDAGMDTAWKIIFFNLTITIVMLIIKLILIITRAG
jgi:hypothetical protein